ncbi:hypothetical protein ABZ054_12725, partial [Streptomyces sp. NPDC006324]
MSLSRAPRRTLFAVGVLTAALALSACGGDGGGTSGGGGTNFVTTKGGISTAPKGERATAMKPLPPASSTAFCRALIWHGNARRA